MSKNYYKILQIDPSAEQEVVEGAYRRLARKYHPDYNSAADATLRIQEIYEAYEVLKDPDKRKRYDKEQSFQSARFEEERRQRDKTEAEQRRAEEARYRAEYEQKRQQQADAEKRRVEYERQQQEQAENARRQAAYEKQHQEKRNAEQHQTTYWEHGRLQVQTPISPGSIGGYILGSFLGLSPRPTFTVSGHKREFDSEDEAIARLQREGWEIASQSQDGDSNWSVTNYTFKRQVDQNNVMRYAEFEQQHPKQSATVASDIGPSNIVPVEIQGLCWGGFLLNIFWGMGNQVWIALLTLIPGVGWVVPFILLFKGNEWAWQARPWDSVEHFKKTQRNWTIAALSIYGISLLLYLFIIILSSTR